MSFERWAARLCAPVMAFVAATSATAASYVQYQVAVDGYAYGLRVPGVYDPDNYGPVSRFTDTYTIVAQQTGLALAVVSGACGGKDCTGYVSESGLSVRAVDASTTEMMTWLFAGSIPSAGGLPLFDAAALTGTSYAQTIIRCPGVDCAKTSTALRLLGVTELGATAATGPSVTLASVTTPLPEPASWMTMIAGFGAVGGALRRRRQATPRPA